MIVMKFGGTSVGTPKMVLATKEIVIDFLKANREDVVVVVSAMSGITDELIKASTLSSKRDRSYKTIFNSIKEKHLAQMNALFNENLNEVLSLLDELEKILYATFTIGEVSKKSLDTIVSFGERINARIVAETFRREKIKSVAVDATDFIITDGNFGNALPLYEESKERARKIFSRLFKEKTLPIVTGFIGEDRLGNITVLGRGGSDFTATIIGRLLDAREVWIWTDADGIETCDPRVVKDAVSIKELSYLETGELSYYGAKVLHSRALLPVLDKDISIRILNTFNRSFEGTLITKNGDSSLGPKAITGIKGLTLLNIQGHGISNIKEFFERVFSILNGINAEPLLISQASSMQSLCLVLKHNEGKLFLNEMKEEFKLELKEYLIEEISEKINISVVSVVGSGMKGMPGIAGKVFKTLGRYGINIIAIAQGSSEYNISFAIKDSDLNTTLNALHTELGLGEKPVKAVNIFQFGYGTIGKEVARLVNENAKAIEKRYGLRLVYYGIQKSDAYALKESVSKVLSGGVFEKKGSVPENLLTNLPLNTVFVDLTASENILPLLLKLKDKGYGIVFANKKNLTQDLESARTLMECPLVRFETTVGGSLPILKTLKQILEGGDVVKKVLMLPSGTLSFVFSKINEGLSPVEAVRLAQGLKMTEPNPIEDLKGFDILRKAQIIARFLGFSENYEFEDFVKSKDLKEFEEKEAKAFENYLKGLSKEGVVFPVAVVTKSLTKVSIESFKNNPYFERIKPSDNLFLIYTEKYNENPIAIQGVGAGLTTAMGVLEDILEVGGLL